MTYELAVPAAASSATAFALVYLLTPVLIRFLEGRGHTVPDMFKHGRVMVARPGGISLVAGMVVSEAVLYAFLPLPEIIAVMATTAAAFAVGYVDDRRVMGGWFKPLALAGAAIPIILVGAYDTNLEFPLFGEVQIPILYLALIVLMIPVTGNTINSIDVINGLASGFMVVASFSLTACLLVIQNYEIAVVSLPLGFASLAFYKYHKLPSRIFPGDSGALSLGAMYGAIAIVGGVEVVSAIALLPAIVNSFLFLSSTRRIVEYRKVRVRPTELTPDLKIKATGQKGLITLLSLIVALEPLTEKQAERAILRLAVFCGILAVISSVMMLV